MTQDQIALVQSSFTKEVPIAETAARLFYARLFEIAPEVRPMFEGDMEEQGRKLMATISVVVRGLAKPETILPAARSLATRHVAYGVRPAHYAPVGEALIWTLEQGLGGDFTPELRGAWVSAYRLVSGVMISAAYDTAAA